MLPVQEILKNKKVVLASGSPRRAEILRNIGLDFETIESGFDEEVINRLDFTSHVAYVNQIAYRKASRVAESLRAKGMMPHLVIGADTIVTKAESIYGKPVAEGDACRILTELSGDWHEVHTGVALVYSGFDYKVFNETTRVKMSSLEPERIDAYIKTGEPMDKAGAYGIQGLGGTLVEKICGDYFNVVGFPLHTFCKNIENIREYLQ